MIDPMDWACPILRAPFFETILAAAGFFGRWGVAGAAILTLLGYGYAYNNARCKKAGVALIVTLIASTVVTELVRQLLQLPRPRLSTSYGFPSGHATAAFSLAGVLATAFPQLGPWVYLIASSTGISRLYFRAHYLWDVFGGAAVGLTVSMAVSRKLLPRTAHPTKTLPEILGWAVLLITGIGASLFFYTLETRISAHLLDSEQASPTGAVVAAVDFGDPRSRPALGYGWSGDEVWEEGKRSVVWATGIASEIKIGLPAVQDYFFRVHVFPYSPEGSACQRIEVKINSHPLADLSLERGWHWYGVAVPRSSVRAGQNQIEFVYQYSEAPKIRGFNLDERELSAAFDRIDLIAAGSSKPRLGER